MLQKRKVSTRNDEKLIQSKYESLHMMGQARLAELQNAGDGDGPKPGESLLSYFLIKAVQIREELQRNGDALDSALRRKRKNVVCCSIQWKDLQNKI